MHAFPVASAESPLLDAWQQDEFLKRVTYGSSPLAACHLLGVSITSFLKTAEADASFAERVQHAHNALSQNVAARLYRTAMEGNVSAQRCYLQFRPPPEWQSAPIATSESEELNPHELAQAYRAAGMDVPAELQALAGRENGSVES
jgi:hypothetical protein